MSLVDAVEARALFGGEGHVLRRIVERIAQPRVVAVPLEVPELAHASEELRTWARLFERYDLEVVDPAETELRPPGLFPRWDDLLRGPRPSLIADVVGAFTSSVVIAQQDEMSFLASWSGTNDGASRIYYFHPSDWGVWPTDASLAGRLFRIVQEEDRPEFQHWRYDGPEEARLVSALKLYESRSGRQPLAGLDDPGGLFARAEWLVRALVGAGRPLTTTIGRALPLRGFAQESPRLEQRHHLALYWLWNHFFLGNDNELRAVLALTARHRHPWVEQSREWLTRWQEGDRQVLGGRSVAEIEETKEELSEVAPPELFSSNRRRAVRHRRSELEAFDQREWEARAPLEEAAARDPEVLEALELIDRLGRSGSLGPELEDDGRRGQQLVDRLCALVDERFTELIRIRVDRGRHVPDSHRDACWGLIEALAVLSSSLPEFQAALGEDGTRNFGPRRQAELYRAIGRFEEEAATDVLVNAADRWLLEVDDWIRVVPSEPVLQLLKRDVLPTHELIARLLERATYSAANVEVCVEAARAAGRLRSQRARAGLRRGVAERLGRVADGGRAAVSRALFEVERDEAGEFFERELDRHLQAWDVAADPDDVWVAQRDLAGLMPGALPSTADRASSQAVLQRLVESIGSRLRNRRSQSAETIESARSLVEAVRCSEQPGLAFRIRDWARISIVPRPSNRPAVQRFFGELEMLLRTL